MKKYILGIIGLLVFAGVAYGAVTLKIRSQDSGYVQNYTFFVATTTTATSTNASTLNDSGYFTIAGAKKVVMYFSRGGVTHANTGSSVFKVQVTPDGTNWYDYNKLVQNSATSTNEWLIGTDSIGAATSTKVDALYLRDAGFLGVRCITVVTTDGEATCSAFAEY